jgi:hypothetical protein
VFAPDPADLLGRIILVLCKPELAFFADDIEDLVDLLARQCKRSKVTYFTGLIC